METNPVRFSGMRWTGSLLLALTLAACGGSDPAAGSSSAGSPTLAAAGAVNGVVARVNGEDILVADYERELARRLRDDSVTDATALAGDVLDGLIEQRLLARAAAGMGITVTPDDVTAEVERLKAMLTSDAAWQQFLADNGYTEAEFRQAQQNVLLAQRVQTVLFAGLNGNVRQVRARHIVVRTEAEANTLLQQLQAGEDFAALAAAYSIDLTSRERGGDLGWFVPGELMDARLGEVAFSLNPGASAGPIATSIGYHIIQSLEFAERPIEPERMGLLMQNIYQTWLEQQFQQAAIERYLP
jgi:parvulin-like peptidyl-prolyl isomerase